MKTDSMGVSSYTNSNYSLNQVTDSELLDKLDSNRGVKRFLSMKKTEDLRREAIANQTKPQPNGTTPLFFIQPTESTSESSEETYTNTRIQSSCPDTNARVQSTCPDDKTGVFGNFKSYSEYMLRRRPKESDVPAVPSSVSVKSILKGKAEEQKPQPPMELPNSARKAVKFSETVVVQQVDEETCTVNVSNCKVDGNFKLPKEANGFPNRTFVSENSPAPSKLIVWKSNLLLAKEKAAFKNPQPTEESTTSDYESTEEAASCLFPKKHAIDGMENVKQHKDETDAPTCCESDTEADIKGGSGDGYDSSSVSSPNAQSTLCDSVDLMLNQLKVGDAPNACITTGDTQAEAAVQPNEQNVIHLSSGSCEEVKTKVSNQRPQNEILQIEKTQIEKLRNERLQAERLQPERLQAKRLQAERLQAERLQAERLQAERLQAEMLQNEMLQNERVQNQIVQNEVVQNEMVQNEKLQNERLQTERIQAEGMPNESIQTEKMPDERTQAHNKRMHIERIPVERMQTERLHSEKIPKEGIQTERLHNERTPTEGIPKEGIQTERLHNEKLHSEGIQNERMQNERINDEGLRNERILHERMLIERLQNEMMQSERMRHERKQNERMRNERMYNEKLKNEMEQETRIPNELRNSEPVSDIPNPHALKASPREQHLAAIYRESEDENFSGTQSDEVNQMETLFKRTLRTNSVPSLDIIQGQMMQQCIVQRAVRSNYKIYTPRRRSRSASRQRFYRKPISPREQPDISIKKKKFDDFNWIKVFAIIVTIVLLLVAVLSFRKEIVDVGQQFAEKIKWLWLQRLKPQPKKIETKQPFYAALRKWMPF